MTWIHEDEELDEMRGFDSGNIPTIDTLDEDNDDIWEKDLSWNILIISIQLYLLFCDLVMVCCESIKLVKFFIILMDCFLVFHLCY